MNQRISIIIVLLLPLGSISQICSYTNNLDKSANLCNIINGRSTELSDDKDAEKIVDKILGTIGAKRRFVIKECNEIDNAVATSYQGVRYILYDKRFMNAIAKSTSSWSNLAILAHEVGHHINGHTLDLILYSTKIVKPVSLDEQKQQELEADEFSGFVLAKLGASLKEASEAIQLLTSNKDDINSTHPTKDKRLAAIKRGFENSLKQSKQYQLNNLTYSSEDFYYRALEKDKAKDYLGAVSDLTRAISLDTNFIAAYKFRAILKYCESCKTWDINGAIQDNKRVLKLLPEDPYVLYDLGLLIGFYKDAKSVNEILINEAIAYYTNAIKIFAKNKNIDKYWISTAYDMRGRLRASLGVEKEALSAFEDFNEAINSDPTNPDFYISRGTLYLDFQNHENACKDFSEANKLGSEEATSLLNKFCKK
jgi:tetratricopeptide (TPR) repeat protein